MECPVSINVEIVYELKHTAKNTLLSLFFFESVKIMGSWSGLFSDLYQNMLVFPTQTYYQCLYIYVYEICSLLLYDLSMVS